MSPTMKIVMTTVNKGGIVTVENPMKSAKQITDDLMHRLKTEERKFYDVRHSVEPGWLPQGSIPFNITVRNGVATFKVYALSQVDAEDQVMSWLEEQEKDSDEF